jgi:hypothetical protein
MPYLFQFFSSELLFLIQIMRLLSISSVLCLVAMSHIISLNCFYVDAAGQSSSSSSSSSTSSSSSSGIPLVVLQHPPKPKSWWRRLWDNIFRKNELKSKKYDHDDDGLISLLKLTSLHHHQSHYSLSEQNDIHHHDYYYDTDLRIGLGNHEQQDHDSRHYYSNRLIGGVHQQSPPSQPEQYHLNNDYYTGMVSGGSHDSRSLYSLPPRSPMATEYNHQTRTRYDRGGVGWHDYHKHSPQPWQPDRNEPRSHYLRDDSDFDER